MKLIIDIDEQHFELLQMSVMNGMGDNAQKIIAQGIPLEQIRDEIVEEQSNWREDADAEWHECRRILRIIDKYKEQTE